MISPLLFWMTHHYHHEDYCKKKFPELDATRCAFSIGFFKKHEFYDHPIESVLEHNEFHDFVYDEL